MNSLLVWASATDDDGECDTPVLRCGIFSCESTFLCLQLDHSDILDIELVLVALTDIYLQSRSGMTDDGVYSIQ